MKVGIIGLGNLGSAVAYLAAGNGHPVLAWEYDQAVVDEVNRQHTNQRYLKGIQLPEQVSATTCVEEVFAGSELVFITLPSRFIPQVLGACAGRADTTIGLVNMAKGLHVETGKTAYQMLAELFPDNPKAMLAGPSLANEFVHGVLTAVVAASDDAGLITNIGIVLNNKRFAVSRSGDVMGVELGGILKNIYALGLGVFADREDRGLNFIGAYLTQAITEIQVLGVALGAKKESFWRLSGIGDLIATAMSPQSHNVTMGKLVAQGLSVAEIEAGLGVLPEGYNTLQVALRLAGEHGVSLPLAALLQRLIAGELSVDAFLDAFAATLSGC